jgi:hypothetical protein
LRAEFLTCLTSGVSPNALNHFVIVTEGGLRMIADRTR